VVRRDERELSMGQRAVVILSQKQDEYTSEHRISGIRNVPSDCPEGTNAFNQYVEDSRTRLLLVSTPP